MGRSCRACRDVAGNRADPIGGRSVETLPATSVLCVPRRLGAERIGADPKIPWGLDSMAVGVLWAAKRFKSFAGEEDWKREDAVEFCLGEAPASYVVFSALGETIVGFTAGSFHAFDRAVREDFDLDLDSYADLFGGVFAHASVPAHFLDVLVVGVDDGGHVGGGELELTAVGIR